MLRLFRYLKPYSTAVTGSILLFFIQAGDELYLSTLMSDIVDQGVVRGVAGGSALCAIVATYLSARIGMGFGRDLRDRVFDQVQRYSLNEIDRFGTATLITAPLMAIGGVIMAYSKDRALLLVLVVSIPVIIIAIAVIAGRGIPLFKVVQQKLDKLNLVLDPDGDPRQPDHGGPDADDDAGDEPDSGGDRLVRRDPHRRGPTESPSA